MQREGLDLSQFGDLDTMLLSRDFDESLAEEKKVDSVDERSHRSVDLPPPAPAPIGIGALAAAAALKKQSARSDEPAPSPGPMGIGALAAAAALKNQSKNGGIQKDSPIDGAVQEPAIRDDPRFSKVRSSLDFLSILYFLTLYICLVLPHAQDGEYLSQRHLYLHPRSDHFR